MGIESIIVIRSGCGISRDGSLARHDGRRTHQVIRYPSVSNLAPTYVDSTRAHVRCTASSNPVL